MSRIQVVAEPSLYQQSRFGGPADRPADQGDCWATAVCILAGLGPAERDRLHQLITSQKYDQAAGEPSEWWNISARFVRDRTGLWLTFGGHLPGLPVMVIASGPSPRGDWLHSVIARGDTGELIFDPHPDGDGLASPADEYQWLVSPP